MKLNELFSNEAAGPHWVGKNWILLSKANAAETVYADNFYEIGFVDIK